MKLLVLVLVWVVCASACSTVPDRVQAPSGGAGLPDPGPDPRPVGEGTDDAGSIEQNGPSAVPRAGWVETVSGWYPSAEACLQQRRRQTTGTPLSVAEECLEVGI